MNQMRVNHNVVCSKISDFEIDRATFEIGGKKKGQKQIETTAKGYIVKDDIEFGYANITPPLGFRPQLLKQNTLLHQRFRVACL